MRAIALCATASLALMPIAAQAAEPPLPPENTAELIALAAGLGAKTGRAKVGSFSLCPA